MTENFCFENISSDISVKRDLNEHNICKENSDDPNDCGTFHTFSICGEVLKSHIKEKFLLICSFCKTVTNNLEEFGTHLQKTHCEFISRNTLGETEISIAENAESLAERDAYSEVNEIYLNEKETNISIGYENYQEYGGKNPISNDEPLSLVSDNCEITDLVQVYTSVSSGTDTQQRQTDILDDTENHKEPTCTWEKLEISDNKTTCKYCGKIYKKQNCLLQHEQYHEQGGKYKCNFPGCEKGFFRRQRMEQHMVSAHGIGEKKYKCTYCERSFVHHTNLKVHIKQQHTHEREFSCERCGKSFVRKIDLNIHMRGHTGEAPHQCELCGQNYKHRHSFSAHMRRHANERTYKCKQCPKAFFTSTALNDHGAVHSNVKPHQCTICSRSFGRKSNLNLHELIHSTIKKYVCNICNKRFSQSSGLYSHKKCHGDPIARSTGKTFN